MSRESAALMTGREVTDCPACEDAGRAGRQLTEHDMKASCEHGHQYDLATSTLYPDGTRRFSLKRRSGWW